MGNSYIRALSSIGKIWLVGVHGVVIFLSLNVVVKSNSLGRRFPLDR